MTMIGTGEITTVEAPAKLNLTLSVGPRRDNGYHDIASWMHPLALADTLHIGASETPGVQLSIVPQAEPESSAHIDVSDLSTGPSNLICRAFETYKTFNPVPDSIGFQVLLEKAIPMQAGLGGGSANAAAMLRFLNKHHRKPLPEEALFACARQLGADVAFGLWNQSVWAKGVGEKLTPIAPLSPMPIFLVKPRTVSISTPAAFQALDADRLATPLPIELPNLDAMPRLGTNDFENPMRARFQALEDVFQTLEMHGLCGHLTGSGSTVFVLGEGLLLEERAQRQLQAAFPAKTYWSIWTSVTKA